MKLLTCIVTFNRLEYTKRCIESYWATHEPANYLLVVDNASTDGTQEWCRNGGIPIVENDRNLFPGAATNLGWHRGLKYFDATHLHRSDNDVEYLPGWRKAAEEAFEATPNLGQLGVLNCHEDYPGGPPFEKLNDLVYDSNPGGNSVIPRHLWDEGLRWEGGPWQPGGNDEDTRMSATIKAKGFVVGRLVETVANNMSFHRYQDYPDYYNASAALRGLVAETSV